MWAHKLYSFCTSRAGMLMMAAVCLPLSGCADPLPPEHTATISRMQGLGAKVMFAEGGYHLNLQNSRITDGDLKEMHKIHNLKVLELTNTQISDEGLKEIEKLKSLTTVTLTATPTTIEGRAALRKARPDMLVRL